MKPAHPAGWRFLRPDDREPWKLIEEECASIEQLFARLQELRDHYVPVEDESPSVKLINAAGDRMRIGLGGEEWVIIYQPASGGVVLSLGDPQAEGYRAF